MNTFLELKVENARLQERLQALRVRSQELSKNQFTRGSLSFSNGSMSAQLAANLGLDSAPGYAQSSYYNSMPPPGYGASAVGYLSQVEDDTDERRAAKRVSFPSFFVCWLGFDCFRHFWEVVRDKRLTGVLIFSMQPKKMYMTDQYVCVTCGRTDSPEWRKVSVVLTSIRCG